MRTDYQIRDRCRVGQELGTIIAILPLQDAYRVKLDNGQTLQIDERLLKIEPPTKETHDENQS